MRSLLLLFFSLMVTSFAGTFGIPPYLWVGTWALTYQNDPCGDPELNRLLLHRDKFVGSLQSHITNSGYNIGFNHRLSYENYNASQSSFSQPDRDLCELVFYTGHGTTAGTLDFRDGSACQYPRYFQYNGYTKWVFLEACHYFQYDTSPWSYMSMFNGVHAIFGFGSMYWMFLINYSSWWDCMWNGCKYYRSEDRWSYFWDNYFSGQEMWTAYSSAMAKSHAQAGKGIAPAAAMLFGNVVDNNGITHFFCGGSETITNSYSANLYLDNSLSVMTVTNTYGTPDY